MQRSITFCEGDSAGVCTLGQEKKRQLEVFMFQTRDKWPLLTVVETLGQG